MSVRQRCYRDQGVRDQDQTGQDWDQDQGGRDQDQDQQGRDQDQDLKKVVLIGLETKTRSQDRHPCSQVKPPNCFRLLQKLVLPSIFDTSISSFVLWNLQCYPTTALNEGMWHFRCGGVKTHSWPLLHIFKGSRPLIPHDLRPTVRFVLGLFSSLPAFLVFTIRTSSTA